MACMQFKGVREDVTVCVNVEQTRFDSIGTFVVQWLCYNLVCPIIDVFGIFANIVNIIIFKKQGFKDTVNISFLGLAVSDIGSVSTLLWTNICYSPEFRELDLPFDSMEVNYLTSGIPHTMFVRITCWITALITLERCLCIAAPLKVKSILTSKRVTIIIIAVFVILMSTAAPVYVANKLDFKFFPDRNKTLLGLVFRKDRDLMEAASYMINNVTLPFTSFVINVVCTSTIVYKLKKTTAWRKKSATCSRGDSVANQKVTKMVVMISALFIACYVPVSLMFVGLTIEPELFLDGKYKHILITLAGLVIILESINSSVNIFIYYNMSTKYRTVFMQLFSTTKVSSSKM